MELRQLEHFIAIAEDGNFTKAARRLNYVQSALSVSVQALERELGVRLFDRSTHRVALTGAGEELLAAARRTIAAAEATLDIAAAIRGVLRGTLRVGIMQSFSYAFADVPGVLGSFHRQHPDVEIEVRPSAGGSAALLQDLRDGGLDIAFLALVDAPPGVTTVPLGSEDLVLVGASGPATDVGDAVRLDDLANATFVDFPVGWGVRTVIDRAFRAKGLDRRVTIEVADVATCIQLLQAGLGVALLPPSLLPEGATILSSRILEPRLSWHVVMATPSGRTHAAAQALADLVNRSSDPDRGVALS